MRCLLFASPIFLFHPLIHLLQGIIIPDLPPPWAIFQLWITGAPYLYCFAVLSCFFERIRIKNGMMEYGMLGLDKIPLSRIVEVAGDEGDASNDFSESILIKFDSKDSDRGLVLPINDYEEHELRAFLSTLREQNPACEYTYSDVIPFESRGLIKFLSSVNESDNLVVRFTKSPMIDASLSMIKAHEKTFWFVYIAFWFLILVAASCYCFAFNAEWAQRPGLTPTWGTSEATKEAARLLAEAQKNPSSSRLDIAYHNFSLACAIGVDFISTTGLSTLTAVWFLGVAAIAILIPIKLASPKHLFIDAKSVGIGDMFLHWEDIISVTLEKAGVMSDPLEGRLILLKQNGVRLNIDLTKIPDVQKRQRALRLIERYATNASFNSEFMRTTNTLVDIQFTDLWLESQPNGQPVEVQVEQRVLCEGKYQLESALGYGGQGVTYLASTISGSTADNSTTNDTTDDTTDDTKADRTKRTITAGSSTTTGSSNGRTEDHRRVVIKELVLPNYADVRIMQDATSRFERGAKLLKELDHPRVVKLLDHFLENGKAYLVMEHVQGVTLRNHIEQNGALEFDKAKELGMRLCDILDYLHSREVPVIHCDFAPDNLIITPEGDLKLIDFDVARVVDNKAHTFIAGRPSYTPPEQFRGQPTIQSDLFALGAIVHYILQGKDPPPLCAGASDDETVWQSNSIEKLIQRCCQFEASARPASAKEIREELERSEMNTTADTSELSDKTSTTDTSEQCDTNTTADTNENNDDDNHSFRLSITKEETVKELS